MLLEQAGRRPRRRRAGRPRAGRRRSGRPVGSGGEATWPPMLVRGRASRGARGTSPSRRRVDRCRGTPVPGQPHCPDATASGIEGARGRVAAGRGAAGPRRVRERRPPGTSAAPTTGQGASTTASTGSRPPARAAPRRRRRARRRPRPPRPIERRRPAGRQRGSPHHRPAGAAEGAQVRSGPGRRQVRHEDDDGRVGLRGAGRPGPRRGGGRAARGPHPPGAALRPCSGPTSGPPTPRSISTARCCWCSATASSQLVTHVSTGTGKQLLRQRPLRRRGHAARRVPLPRRITGWREAPLGRLYNPVYFNGGIAVHGAAVGAQPPGLARLRPHPDAHRRVLPGPGGQR